MTDVKDQSDAPRVTLSVVAGPGSGTRYEFEERTTALVGRAEDCDPQIEDRGGKRVVSRHHCLFDINPPDVRVRDFGSLNGTHVNKEKIGSRDPDETPEQGAARVFPERDLVDGDRITLGDTVLEVAITMPAPAPLADASTPRQCSLCAQPVAPDPHHTSDEAVCARCRADRDEAIAALLAGLVAGKVELPAIEGYELVEKIGEGGQGVVYKARRREDGELVAVKMMLAKVAVNERSRAMFEREIAGVQALEHPHVVGFRESGRAGPAWFFTSEYCAGGSADDLVTRAGPLAPETAVGIVLQALDGLAHAHTVALPDGSVGLVHRDIKPSNILLARNGNEVVAKLADFGLSKAFDKAGLSGMTMSGTIGGTVPFMARPQVVSFKYAKPEVDVWSMAATLYWMLTGRYARDFPKREDPIRVILDTTAIPIRKRDRRIPARLAEVIDEALIDKPIAVTSAAELSAALRDAM